MNQAGMMDRAAGIRRGTALRIAGLLAALVALLSGCGAQQSTGGASAPQQKTLRIGYQRGGSLTLLKAQATLEQRLKPLGVAVEWKLFASGPPLLEAMNTGNIDLGTTGEPPLQPWLVPVTLLLWQALSAAQIINPRVLPAPFGVVKTAVEMVGRGQLLPDMWISFQRALAGFLIGGSIGFALGLLNGFAPLSERLLDSSLQMVRTIPRLSLIPLVILWFGIGDTARLFLVALGVLFPVYINTLHGVRSVEPGLIEMGRVYGLSTRALFWQVILPGALPSILVGLRYALGIMWLTLIVAETIAADTGIGHITMNAREFMQTDVVVLGIVIYALLGKLADSTARLCERRLLRWHPNYQ